ncbi:hypothetical protein ASZ90_008534 [hydrocarbon metagenome]|uniref:Uncharacterized protein n=1 Tax=hydrocarbon metagenome TaxID=938273 RepID=A0A0W8FLF4_9ZZZZ
MEPATTCPAYAGCPLQHQINDSFRMIEPAVINLKNIILDCRVKPGNDRFIVLALV